QGLVEGSDGVFYGLTYAGGTLDRGFIYKLRKDGVYGAVYNFTGPHNDGGYPSAVLTEGSDHLLYGITAYGGKNGGGTVFKIQADGSAFASLHSFTNVDREPRLPVGGV